MKKLIITCIIFIFAVNIHAQEENKVEVGQVFEIVKPSGNDFQHIHFPKKNIIIKRGGIANDKFVVGKKIVVSEIKTQKDGTKKVVVKLKDGSNFYKAIPTVAIDIDNALKNGEIKKS